MKKELEDFLFEKNVIFFRCLRCKHEWIPRGKKPRFCPKCNSSYWDKKRKNKKH